MIEDEKARMRKHGAPVATDVDGRARRIRAISRTKYSDDEDGGKVFGGGPPTFRQIEPQASVANLQYSVTSTRSLAPAMLAKSTIEQHALIPSSFDPSTRDQLGNFNVPAKSNMSLSLIVNPQVSQTY